MIVCTAIVALIASCDRDSNDFVQSKNGMYFPLQNGMAWYDSVTHISIDAPSGIYDTAKFLKQTIIDSIVPEVGIDKIYCSQYIFDNQLNYWAFQHRYWYELSTKKLIRFEQNEIWQDFVFPLHEGLEWNLYAYGVYSDTLVRNRVAKIDISGFVNNTFYDSILEVQHHMDSTLVYKHTDKSIYAAGVGFIKRKFVSIVSDDPNYDYTLPIESRIKTATILVTKRYYYD